MEVISLHSTLTPADWRALQAAWTLRLRANGRPSWRLLVGVVLLAVFIAVTLVTFSHASGAPVPFVALTIGAALAVLVMSVLARRLQRAAQPDAEGIVLGPIEYRISERGIETRKQRAAACYEWSAFQDAQLTPEHLFIWIDRTVALIVPLRDLPAGVTALELCEQLRGYAAADASRAPPQSAERTPTDAAPTQSSAGSIGAVERRIPLTSFLGAVARTLALRPAAGERLSLDDVRLTLLALSGVGAWLLFDWLRAGAGAEFYAYGFVPLGWLISVVLATAACWSRLSEPHVAFRSALAAGAALAIAILLALAGVSALVPYEAWLGVLTIAAAYASLCGAMLLRALTSRPQPRAVFAGLLVLSFGAWLGGQQYADARFFYPPQTESDVAEADQQWNEWTQLGELLFEQPDRIDAAAARLERPAEGPAAFFIGFAGMGEQKVFAEEIALASRVIGAAFGASERSLLLVNDRRDLQAHPLASPPALRRTVARVAQRMNLEQDVLFLALSSHGSEDGELSVSNGAAPLASLTAEHLAETLRRAGVRNRVIIVSACYSGTFIEPLRDEHTVIITAAAADRTSFGCSDDRDLTYFGEAFYRDALPRSPDLRTAFKRAAAAIAAREAEEGLEPSQPQAHFGASLEARLAQLAGDRAQRLQALKNP